MLYHCGKASHVLSDMQFLNAVEACLSEKGYMTVDDCVRVC